MAATASTTNGASKRRRSTTLESSPPVLKRANLGSAGSTFQLPSSSLPSSSQKEDDEIASAGFEEEGVASLGSHPGDETTSVGSKKGDEGGEDESNEGGHDEDEDEDDEQIDGEGDEDDCEDGEDDQDEEGASSVRSQQEEEATPASSPAENNPVTKPKRVRTATVYTVTRYWRYNEQRRSSDGQEGEDIVGAYGRAEQMAAKFREVRAEFGDCDDDEENEEDDMQNGCEVDDGEYTIGCRVASYPVEFSEDDDEGEDGGEHEDEDEEQERVRALRKSWRAGYEFGVKEEKKKAASRI